MNKISIRILIRSVSTVLLACLMFNQVSSQSLYDQIKTNLEPGKKLELNEFKGKTIGMLLDSMGKNYLYFWFLCVGDRIDANKLFFKYDYNDSLVIELKITCIKINYSIVSAGELLLLPLEEDLIRYDTIYSAIIELDQKKINEIADYQEDKMITRNWLISREYIWRHDSLFADEYYRNYKQIKDYKLSELRITHYFNHLAGLSLREIINILGKPDYYIIRAGSKYYSTTIKLRYFYDSQFSILLSLDLSKENDHIQSDNIEPYNNVIVESLFVSAIPNTIRNDLIPYKK